MSAEHSLLSLHNPELWFSMASTLVIIAGWKPMGKLLAGVLDARAKKIRDEINEAENLIAEAKTLLARYTGQLAGAEAEAQKIIAQAEKDAEQIRQRAAKELEHALVVRQQHVLDRIAQAEAAAVAEIRDATVSVTMAASRNALRHSLNDNQKDALIQKAVGAVQKNLR